MTIRVTRGMSEFRVRGSRSFGFLNPSVTAEAIADLSLLLALSKRAPSQPIVSAVSFDS